MAPTLLKGFTVDQEKRPWGSYQVLAESKDFKVKKIHVLPGEVLSYQTHEKRDEDWVIISGGGFVVLDDKVLAANKGDHFKILAGVKHRIGSNNDIDGLTFIEVQTGAYFGEDDIVRYSDEYDRV